LSAEKIQPFMFLSSFERFLAKSDTFFYKVPQNISGKRELFEKLAVSLHFPDYFGGNWDALEDLLTDLSWIEMPVLVLAHDDLPFRNNRDCLIIYLSVLKAAVMSSLKRSDKEFVVVFPVGFQTEILEVLGL